MKTYIQKPYAILIFFLHLLSSQTEINLMGTKRTFKNQASLNLVIWIVNYIQFLVLDSKTNKITAKC